MSRNPAEIIAAGLARLEISLPPEAIDRLARYFLELKKWNRAINLVGKAADEELLERHFLDSLTILPLLKEWGFPPPLLDVGTGGGFPGLVLKAGVPELEVTLLEPRLKRVSFLKQISRTLGLDKVTILAARLEEGGRLEFADKNQATNLGPHPVITSRAFTQIEPFLKLAAPICPPGGRVICMKGARAQEEIAEWQNTPAASADFTLTEQHTVSLPFSGNPRTLLVFSRTP